MTMQETHYGPYKDRFRQALERCESYGVPCDFPDDLYEGSRLAKPVLNVANQRVAQIIKDHGFEALVGESISLSRELAKVIRQRFQIPAVATLGKIVLEGVPTYENPQGPFIMFDNPEQVYRDLVDASAPRPRFSFHAWVTLDSMEVIDATFATSHAVILNQPVHGGVIHRHADSLGKMTYHPMVAGDAYFKKAGLALPTPTSSIPAPQGLA